MTQGDCVRAVESLENVWPRAVCHERPLALGYFRLERYARASELLEAPGMRETENEACRALRKLSAAQPGCAEKRTIGSAAGVDREPADDDIRGRPVGHQADHRREWRQTRALSLMSRRSLAALQRCAQSVVEPYPETSGC
jgi:hypothetical protein